MKPHYQRKIISITEITPLLADARRRNRSVVQCHGCFDIVHPGHIRYLEFARRQGDLLVVTLTGDSEISKGDQRPYIPQELRAENLAALEFVDYVCIDPAPTAELSLQTIKPDVYVKGREYEKSRDERFLRERKIVEDAGGRVIFSSGEIIFSSSSIINAIQNQPQFELESLAAICRRHDITAASLNNILSKFKGLKVLVVGDTLLDNYVSCDPIDVASESPMMSLAEMGRQTFIGGAAIVARHIAAMGGSPYLLTAGADDAVSRQSCQSLKREGVRVYMMRQRDALVEKTRFLADDVKLMRIEKGQSQPLDSKAEQRALAVASQQAADCDAAVFCDFGYGMITGSLLQRALPVVREQVNILAANISGPRANLLNFKDADLLCPTERELRATLHDFDQGLSSVAWNLLNHTQARKMIVTLAKRGLVTFSRRTEDPTSNEWSARLQSEHLPSFTKQATDALGCGDTLLAVALLSLTAGANLMQAAYLGNTAAALQAAQQGNVPIDIHNLKSTLQSRPELHDHSTTPEGITSRTQSEHQLIAVT